MEEKSSQNAMGFQGVLVPTTVHMYMHEIDNSGGIGCVV